MAEFDKAITAVLKDEGGLVNNPQDPGGVTNFGISLRFYKTVKPDATAADIKAMTRDMAIEIYQKCFWEKEKYGSIADQKIATKVFDFAVNMGPIPANKCVQRAVIATNNRNIEQDGVLGPNSLYAINYSPPDCVLAALKSEAAGYYRALVAEKPSLKPFLTGWLTRAYSDV